MTNLDTRTEANDAFVSSEIINDPIIDNSFDIIEEPVKKASLTSSVLYFKEAQVSLVQNLIDSIDDSLNEETVLSAENTAETVKNTFKYYAKENTLSSLRKLANQNLLALEVEKEKAETSNYLTVVNNNELDPFDNSLLATIIRYKNTLISAFTKLRAFIKDSFSKEY